MYKSVRGTKDILAPEIFFWQQIETKARRILSNYGYEEIRTPLIEEIGLFNRSLGASSEVVNKQMFLVKRALCKQKCEEEKPLVLRPEGTASVVRAYLENHLDKKKDFVKFFYIGAMFRAERPQKGRLRQFHHLGVEAIGSGSAYLDVELIMLAKHLLDEFGIVNYSINLNSLGCKNDKKIFASFIKESLKEKIKHFCSACQERYRINILRVLDCKNKTCQEILKGLKIKYDYLCPECLKHFNEVKEGLNALNIEYKISPLLVRGLDYYTRTVFEITHQDLGSQDAIGAGGRYDDLVEELGGPPKPAAGFALGLERLLLVIKEKTLDQRSDLIYLIALGKNAKINALKILNSLRQNNIRADSDYQDKSLKAALRRADSLKAKFVIILGDLELDRGVVQLRDMQEGTQKEINLQALIKEPLKYLC
jgi:histidyl-tRNA synthetase